MIDNQDFSFYTAEVAQWLACLFANAASIKVHYPPLRVPYVGGCMLGLNPGLSQSLR